MKRVVLLLLVLLAGIGASAQYWRKPKRQWPKTEGELMYKLVGCLQHKDTAGYYDLFPPFDTLWSMVMHNTDKSPQTQKELNNLKEKPQVLIEFDPLYNKSIIGGFCHVLSKGEDSGIQWNRVTMARYELRKQDPTRALIGYDHIAPERFHGYMFVTDVFNRVMFCVSVTEIQKIKGQFFGGQLVNVLQAKSIDEFRRKELEEQAWLEWKAAHPDTVSVDSIAVADSLAAADTADKGSLLLKKQEDPEEDEMRKEVVDRKYYEGLMDNEIPIKLYVRYMKPIPGKPQQYDGLYKLGENKRYLKLEITQNKEGKWIIEDETAQGLMELTLTGRNYVGAWTNAEENGFDVELHQTGTPKGKIETLDAVLDRGRSGRIDESVFEDQMKEDEEKDKKAKEKLAEEREAEKERLKKEQEKKERKEKKKKKDTEETPAEKNDKSGSEQGKK